MIPHRKNIQRINFIKKKSKIYEKSQYGEKKKMSTELDKMLVTMLNY